MTIEHQKPVLYFSPSTAGCSTFHLSAQKYDTDSDWWENNNIELKSIWFSSKEAAFNTLSNVCQQAGITLLMD